MVPEAYRQKFRDYRMGENQTYVEFYRQKETYLERWIAAKGIGTDYNKLRQLILIEEFKWCVHDNVKTFLNERQVDTGYEMVTLADEYTLTHQRDQNKSEDPSEYRRSVKPRITTNTSSRARLGQTTYLHRPSSPNNMRPTPHSLIPQHMEGGRNLTCYYCRKAGHLAANCYARKSAEHKNGSLNKPHGFISSRKESNKRTESWIREEYKPFISNGYVHPVDDATKRVEIKILRDTGATQSLMVKNDMPRESETATGERVVIQGVGGNVVSVPLHQISLDSEIVCGTVIVGVVDSLPMQGISMLLGNDLAGERVVPHPRMVEKLSVSEETKKIEREHPETLLPCVVTQAEAKRTEDSTTKMESEENEIIDLSKTCLNHEIGLNPMLEQTPSSNPNPQEKIIDVAPVTEKSIAVEQREDDQIAPLFEKSLLEELNKVPSEYFIEDDILTSTSTGKIMKSLTNFFSMVGLPKIVQSAQGQSQGALERFHSTLKTMIRAYCLDHQKDWDEGIPFPMFAARDAPQESLGFSPFELIVGHTVPGPLSMLKEKWLKGNPANESLLEYVSRFQTRLQETRELARKRLKTVQSEMKIRYDRNTVHRYFQAGDKVFVLLPLSGHPLKARFHGPYEIIRKVSDLNYVLKTPDRRKKIQLCHINVIRSYYERGKQNPLLALVLSLRHFDVYASSSYYPIVVHTNHNPLTFLHRMKSKNKRLLNWSLILQE